MFLCTIFLCVFAAGNMFQMLRKLIFSATKNGFDFKSVLQQNPKLLFLFYTFFWGWASRVRSFTNQLESTTKKNAEVLLMTSLYRHPHSQPYDECKFCSFATICCHVLNVLCSRRCCLLVVPVGGDRGLENALTQLARLFFGSRKSCTPVFCVSLRESFNIFI